MPRKPDVPRPVLLEGRQGGQEIGQGGHCNWDVDKREECETVTGM
jgi:hypothetical protein